MKVDEIKRIAIVGAGLMGHGIAQEFALAGYEVHLHDVTEERLQQALKNMERNVQMLMKIGSVTTEQAASLPTHIRTGTVLKDAVRDAHVVIESVFEDLALKQQIFQELDKMCPEPAVLASNTSTFMPSKLAQVTRRSDKVLVAHYFNPPYLLPLVEVVPSRETSEETVTTVYDLLTKVGKRPVIVQKEVPGFIGNRLQLALFREALAIVEQGIARPQDVDVVIKNGFGRRLAVAGVFEIFEIAGLDLILAIASQLLPEINSSPEVPRLLREKVERGELGVKTGKGFYDWTPESAEGLKERIGHALVKIAQWS